MSVPVRPATAEETERLWPAVRAARIMDSLGELVEYREAGPWRVRVTDRGDAVVLGSWRAHSDVLAMRGLWGSHAAIKAFTLDAHALARAHGYARVMSPLLPVWALEPYETVGMQRLESIVALQGVPREVRGASVPDGVRLRLATPADLDALLELDASCFDEFWRYGAAELSDLGAGHRLVVAEQVVDAAQPDLTPLLIGYTLATVGRGAATLARIGVAPATRRRGLGAALVADVAAWADRSGATTLSLCTQESNEASRSLYQAVGLHEVADRYAFAASDARTEVRS